jgi:hypothetical protein
MTQNSEKRKKIKREKKITVPNCSEVMSLRVNNCWRQTLRGMGIHLSGLQAFIMFIQGMKVC